jgi:hypothetical protein
MRRTRAEVGVAVGAPAGRYLAIGDAALRGTFPDADPVIWPEHFDVAVTVDAANYGVSPGDGFQSEPYAYVGPHDRQHGEFWNAPFGAARTIREPSGVGGVADFFGRGRRLLGGNG